MMIPSAWAEVGNARQISNIKAIRVSVFITSSWWKPIRWRVIQKTVYQKG
jgi:hypothetical protein